ncbi:MAG: tRNA-intron lyase [Candidatus Lokiarchaeota archaeon]|jgi:tRNA-intron endonuclease|nr:tRNA-intron lyase [Candidatus Lokiarchaeota archaeon]
MTEESEDKEKIQVEGTVKKDKVIITDPDGIEEFYEGSFIGNLEEEGDEKILILDPIEVLLLCERKRIILWEENDKSKDQYDFEGLISYFSQFDTNLWQKYAIYMDLRRRGYIVRSGFGDGIEFRVFKRGADFREDVAKYLIYPVFEGSPIELRDLDKISRVALSSRKDLVVATVDRLSKPIYYSVKKFEILSRDISGDKR